MRVLLAGASGAIGRHLVPQLIEAKHEVIGITRTPGSLTGTGAQEVVADVLDRDALLAAVDGVSADAVIHQVTSLKKSPSRFRDMRETNRLRAEGTSALIAVARAVGATRFVAASFFGGYGLFDHGRTPLTEESPFGELDGSADAVQRALLSLEQQVHAFGGVSLRFGLFYDDATGAISPVSRSWDGLLPMLHVSDAAAATVLALARYKPGAVYNIADGHPLSYRARETARAKAAQHAGPTRLPDGVLRRVAPFGSLLLTRASMSLSTALAEAELGWTPKYPSLFECLGLSAPRSERLVLPLPEPKPPLMQEPDPVPEPEPVAEPDPAPEAGLQPEPEPVAEAGLVPELEPELEPVAEPEPEPESAAEPDPAPEAPDALKPVAKANPTPNPAPKPPVARKPRAPRTSAPKDPFGDMDDAIARIGTLAED